MTQITLDCIELAKELSGLKYIFSCNKVRQGSLHKAYLNDVLQGLVMTLVAFNVASLQK